MDLIKDAFQKVRQDIDSLSKETDSLRKALIETRERMIEMCEVIKQLGQKLEFKEQKQDSAPSTHTSTDNPVNSAPSTHTSTDNTPFKPLNPHFLGISSGNEGVSTDRQTDRQTDQQTAQTPQNSKNSIDNAAQILDSLDSIKKEIRLKFKNITNQELLIFSTIYQLEEEGKEVDYRLISQHLNLTESSIRDYVQRLIKKGIPLEKKKINNKSIQLSISSNLKKIATLSTILQLREL
jgi:hypothetical protein